MLLSPWHMYITVVPPSVSLKCSTPTVSSGQYTSSWQPCGSSHTPNRPHARVIEPSMSFAQSIITVSPAGVSMNR